VTVICRDAITLPVDGVAETVPEATSQVPAWQRWNDYGIGLFRKGNAGSEKGQLKQAAAAFDRVEDLERFDGPLNLARVYLKEGRLDDAVNALRRTEGFEPRAPRWTVAWLTGEVDRQNGFFDKAIEAFKSILEDRYPELDERGFDFSRDYMVINTLGLTYFERAKQERGEARKASREAFLRLAIDRFRNTLEIDSENLTAHYNLGVIYAQLGEEEKAEEHRALHAKYRPDDNARDRAVTIHRRKNPAADHAAQAVVIYSLQRKGAPGL
ncbi:MAG: tetratricopeptide repeat protein, partial [Verrucomicrobiota bacterium]